MDTHTTPIPDDSQEILRAVAHVLLQQTQTDERIARESPPEALLGDLLRIALSSSDGASLEILTRQRIMLPTDPAVVVEPDLVIRDPATDSTVIVEVEGHAWHRRDPDEHDEEIRRDRQIRRYYPHLYRYSAREVMRDPWGTMLDIHTHLRAANGFEDLQLNAGVRAIAEACASTRAGVPDQAAGHEDNAESDSVPTSPLEYIRSVTATLPPPPPTSDPGLQRVRQRYPRMYAPWTTDELNVLREVFYAAVDVSDIALGLGRTERAIWARLQRMGIIQA